MRPRCGKPPARAVTSETRRVRTVSAWTNRAKKMGRERPINATENEMQGREEFGGGGALTGPHSRSSHPPPPSGPTAASLRRKRAATSLAKLPGTGRKHHAPVVSRSTVPLHYLKKASARMPGRSGGFPLRSMLTSRTSTSVGRRAPRSENCGEVSDGASSATVPSNSLPG